MTIARWTDRRLAALRYARGDALEPCPTYGVARPLELAGFLAWAAYRPGAPARERRIAAADRPRGWALTAKGRAVLAELEGGA